MLDSIPYLGCGIGHREELDEGLRERASELDVVEIITERYFDRRHDELEALCARWPAIPHGVSLSVGAMGPLDRDYLRGLRAVSEVTKAPYVSDHLCFTRVPGLDLGHLAPLWYTEPVLRNAIDRVNAVQDYVGKPLVIENITEVFTVPGATMSSTEFFCRVVEATGCGILLDVANVHANSVNHGFDPYEYMAAMPLDRVIHVHLAGGFFLEGVLIDSHAHPVADRTWQLLSWLLPRANVRTIILEHDASFPETVEPLLAQVRKARAMVRPEVAAARA